MTIQNLNVVQVVLDKPLNQAFDYLWDTADLGQKPKIGLIVACEFGRTKTVGVVAKVSNHSDMDIKQLKKIRAVSPLQPFEEDQWQLFTFISRYYLCGLGEVVLPSIPKWWREPANWEKPMQPKQQQNKKNDSSLKPDSLEKSIQRTALNHEQLSALEILEKETGFNTFLLQGVTGSGKTALYLNWIKTILEETSAQILILLPEINLTPQLERRIEGFFPYVAVVTLHSSISDKKRALAWQEAQSGVARIIIGTRLAVLTPLPNLSAIVVDEENDSSYKQQDGVRYSARDLAIWRAKQKNIPILLASATPSLETWIAAKEGRYKTLKINQRARGEPLPRVGLIKETSHSADQISEPIRNKLKLNLDKKQQSLILINRRGFAPVMTCLACGWLSHCSQCSAYTVLHRAHTIFKKPVLSCHHCGLTKPVVSVCPECGNTDLQALGRGTQKIEDILAAAYPHATVLRIDTDAARSAKKTEQLIQEIHDGSADIVVGTQMIAKGHDYQNMNLVCVLDADTRLYSVDFRAAEHLFAQLIQVAGRAGRGLSRQDNPEIQSEILIETNHPDAAVYQFLLRYDVDGFMKHLAEERSTAKLPPFSYQAVVHADSKSLSKTLQFLNALRMRFVAQMNSVTTTKGQLRVYDPVPKIMQRLAGNERAQLLIESENRAHLQSSLEILDQILREQSQGRISKKEKVRWLIERDPLLI